MASTLLEANEDCKAQEMMTPEDDDDEGFVSFGNTGYNCLYLKVFYFKTCHNIIEEQDTCI